MSNIAISSTQSVVPSHSKGLNIALWIAQALLAAMFLMSGLMKTTLPIAELAQKMSVPTVLGEGMTRFIGISELLGAIGVLLPALTRVKPALTALAAAGLGVVMVLGAGYHLLQGELGGVPVTVVLAALAFFVAWGRYRVAPIASRR